MLTMEPQVVTLEMVEDAEADATEQEGYADDAESNVAQTDNELAEAEGTEDEDRLSAELESYQQEAESEREEATRLREIAANLRAKYERQIAGTDEEEKPVTFTVKTTMGDAEGERGETDFNGGYVWRLHHPWGDLEFCGTLAEAKTEMRSIVKRMEKEDAGL